MMTIDISEESLARESSGLLRTLLKDRTTNKSIVWATHSYELLGKGFGLYDRITPSKVTGPYANLIQPRSEKSKYEQKDRTKVRAEVFTPTWLVKQQIDAVDQDFRDQDLEAYLDLKWLEITCGEAPYMVSRYDTVTGQALDLEERVGFLDRKLHRLSQQVHEEEAWFQGAVIAYQNAYGYEYQGDSLLLARENLLASFIDYYQAKFDQEPSPSQKQTIAQIISYNVLQMDGLTYTSPYSEQAKEAVQLSLFEEIAEQTSQPQKAQIKDWKTNELIDFERLSQGESPMKFDVVIGNPPYQEELEGTSDKQIYNLFMESGYKIGKIGIFITPGKFLFNAGKTPKAWNNKMLTDRYLRVVMYEPDSRKIFTNTSLSSSLVITIRDIEKPGNPIVKFYADERMRTIVNKVQTIPRKHSLMNSVTLQSKFDLSKLVQDFPDDSKKIGSERRLITSILQKDFSFFMDSKLDDNFIKIWGNDRDGNLSFRFIHNKYIDSSQVNLPRYKVILGATNGGAGKLGSTIVNIIGQPKIIHPYEGFTQTFISIGNFDCLEEAENLSKYLKCKFSRFLIGTLKATSRLNKEVFENVPLQDFTSSSDIDWSQSVAEIDAQLYKKYGLSQEEIDFIESKVKAMD